MLLPMEGELKDKLSEREMQPFGVISYENHWKVGGKR